jgi:SAM-dependent methyltransferase
MELEAVKARYARRRDGSIGSPYAMSRPEMRHTLDERRRLMQWFLAKRAWHDLSRRCALEIGCGEGNVLEDLLQIGFSAERLIGVDLLPERVEMARRKLPAEVRLFSGDASVSRVDPLSQDLVLQFTVFSSILDPAFQKELADTMWGYLKPSGAILWYDAAVSNPRNPDMQGVPVRRIKELFPRAKIETRRVTLAPPLARAACRLHPSLYPLLSSITLLRSHVMAWIEKPAD